jgi:hypothetical protein
LGKSNKYFFLFPDGLLDDDFNRKSPTHRAGAERNNSAADGKFVSAPDRSGASEPERATPAVPVEEKIPVKDESEKKQEKTHSVGDEGEAILQLYPGQTSYLPR